MIRMIKWIFWSVIAIGWVVNIASILEDVKKQEGATDEQQFFEWMNEGNNAVKTIGIFVPPIGGVLGIANLSGYSDEELSAVLDGFSSNDDPENSAVQERKVPEPMKQDVSDPSPMD